MTEDQELRSGKWHRLTDEIVEQKIRENGGPIRLHLPAVTSVDLYTGSTTMLEPGIYSADESACLAAWIDAQSEFAPLPEIGGVNIKGFRMTGRVLEPQNDDTYPSPSANLLVIESPNQVWAMTVGFARREPVAAHAWELLVKTTSKVAPQLEYPSLPWVAWYVSAADGATVIQRVPVEIEHVRRTMVLALFRYYAMIDYINADN